MWWVGSDALGDSVCPSQDGSFCCHEAMAILLLLIEKYSKDQAWHLKNYQLTIYFFKEQNNVDTGKLFFVVVPPTQKFHGGGTNFLIYGERDDLKD